MPRPSRSARSPTQKATAVGIAIAFLALGAVVAYGLAGPDNSPRGLLDLVGDDAPGSLRGLLWYRAGDRLAYTMTGAGEGTLDLRILAPRDVVAANLTAVPGLPLLASARGAGPEATEAFVMDLRHGGLAVNVEGCIVDPALPCREEGRNAYVSWQECPIAASFNAPVDMIPRAALANLPRSLAIADPLKGTTWTFNLRSEPEGRLRVELQEASASRVTCTFGARAWIVDLESGLVEAIEAEGLTLRLASIARGSGPAIPVGGGPPQGAALVAPATPRAMPYPPGAEALGPKEWTLGEAWRQAAAASDDLRAFLARNPDAFVYHAKNGSGQGDVLPGVAGGVRVAKYAWTFQVLGLDRRMIEVTALKETTQGAPKYTIEVAPAPAPADVPARFVAPTRTSASLSAFVNAAAEKGYATPRGVQDATFAVLFDGEDADYVYTLAISTAKAGRGVAGAEVAAGTLDEWMTLNADTGRVTDAVIAKDGAKRVAGAGGAGA